MGVAPGENDGGRARVAGAAGGAAHEGKGGNGMRAAINPVVTLAVFQDEFTVFAGRGAVRGDVADDRDLGVDGGASGVERERQEGQRHRRVEDGAGRDGIVEEHVVGGAVEIEFAQDLKSAQRRPGIVGRNITQKHEGLGRVSGGIGGDVIEIVAEGIGATVQHEGVLFVGIKARQVAIVLIVEGAGDFRSAEIAAAGVGGEDDGRGVRRIGDGVGADLRRGVERQEGGAGGHDFFEPPHFEHIGAGRGVDGDDGTLGGRSGADAKGIQVSGRKVVRPAGNVTADFVA